MSGSPGDQAPRNSGGHGNSRAHKKRKADQKLDQRRQRAARELDLLVPVKDAQGLGAPDFPPVDTPQLHRLAPGSVGSYTYRDGFKLVGVPNPVNWVGAVDHGTSPMWASRVAVNNPEALAALATSLQAIGAKEQGTTARLVVVFEPADSTRSNSNASASTAGARLHQNVAGPSANPFGGPGSSFRHNGAAPPAFKREPEEHSFARSPPGVKREPEGYHFRPAAPVVKGEPGQDRFAPPGVKREPMEDSRPPFIPSRAVPPPVNPFGNVAQAVAVKAEPEDDSD
ncbi:hypothetical protein QBC39DRAFT_431513 [Podospora conica]|nr:hypothetical protein QBC39DRAFT_431513 [Schizothecium conicum]